MAGSLEAISYENWSRNLGSKPGEEVTMHLKLVGPSCPGQEALAAGPDRRAK